MMKFNFINFLRSNFKNYSTVTYPCSIGIGNSYNPAKSYSLKLSVVMQFSYLWISAYSPYQQELFDIISKFHNDDGWNFKQISDWLNANGYKTPRNKTFTDTHVWSIYTKKNRSIKRFSREFEADITEMAIDIVDYMPVNASTY
jgi:hypothetical protein